MSEHGETEIYDLEKHRARRRQLVRQTGKFHGGLTAVLLLFSGGASLLHEPEDLTSWALLLPVFALLSFMIAGLVSWPFVFEFRASRISGVSLPSIASWNALSIEKETSAILKLNPPAEVLEDTLALRAVAGEVLNNLVTLRRLMPKEDLTHSEPVKWLSSTLEAVKELRSELEAARFQAYVKPVPEFSHERSHRALREERQFVEEVLRGCPAEAIGPPLPPTVPSAPVPEVTGERSK